jgi:hypothetical protein
MCMLKPQHQQYIDVTTAQLLIRLQREQLASAIPMRQLLAARQQLDLLQVDTCTAYSTAVPRLKLARYIS